jgi:uncharacterized protein (TIGR02147 family)
MDQFDYRGFLQEELLVRCKRNPAYSARAMARDLGLSAPFFSQILSKRRVLSEERAHVIAGKMSWTRWKRQAFIQLTRYESLQDQELREQVLREVKILLAKVKSRASRARLHKVRLEEFKIVSDWYHLAIFELASTRNFQSDSRWIANKLGISPQQAEAAIARLVQVNLLERRADGSLQKSKNACKMGATPAPALRSFHTQQLDIAKAALTKQPAESRDFSGTTIAINPKKLPRAKALIRRFNHQLMQLLETGEQTAVYHLAIQLYRLDDLGED